MGGGASGQRRDRADLVEVQYRPYRGTYRAERRAERADERPRPEVDEEPEGLGDREDRDAESRNDEWRHWPRVGGVSLRCHAWLLSALVGRY